MPKMLLSATSRPISGVVKRLLDATITNSDFDQWVSAREGFRKSRRTKTLSKSWCPGAKLNFLLCY
jgi:hypothetical protein